MSAEELRRAAAVCDLPPAIVDTLLQVYADDAELLGPACRERAEQIVRLACEVRALTRALPGGMERFADDFIAAKLSYAEVQRVLREAKGSALAVRASLIYRKKTP